MMDYPCAKFGDFSFSYFGFADRQTDRITDAKDRCTHMTTITVSKDVWEA